MENEMSLKDVYNEVKEWNISYSDEWAMIVAKAYCEGYVFNRKNRWHIEETTVEDVRLELCGSSFGGPFAWIDRNGTVIPVGFGMHDPIAEMLLGWSVADVEKRYARLTMTTKEPIEAMKYVENIHQTDEMLISIHNRMSEMNYWNWPKEKEPTQ